MNTRTAYEKSTLEWSELLGIMCADLLIDAGVDRKSAFETADDVVDDCVCDKTYFDAMIDKFKGEVLARHGL